MEKKEVYAKLAELVFLGDHWDGDKAHCIFPECIRNAKKVLDYFFKWSEAIVLESIKPDFITPLTDGAFLMDFYFLKRNGIEYRLTLEIRPTLMAYNIFGNKSSREDHVFYNENDLNEVFNKLLSLNNADEGY